MRDREVRGRGEQEFNPQETAHSKKLHTLRAPRGLAGLPQRIPLDGKVFEYINAFSEIFAPRRQAVVDRAAAAALTVHQSQRPHFTQALGEDFRADAFGRLSQLLKPDAGVERQLFNKEY